MKFIACSDFHITDHRPKSRLDSDYFETCINKLKQIYDYAKDNNISRIIQAGDFFDSARASDYIKQKVISLLSEYKNSNDITTSVIFGQHDLRFHNSNIENTPLKVLESAGVVSILYNQGVHAFTDTVTGQHIYIYGASWNETPQEIKDKDAINILVMHKMIIKDKLWEQQEDATFVNNLFRQFPHTYMITGDNHQHFTSSVSPKGKDKRFAINCGSLMRSSIIQTAHKPCFYVVDTLANTIEHVLLKVAEIESIMRVEQAEEEKRTNDDLAAFIEGIQTSELTAEMNAVNFIQNIRKQAEQEAAPVQEAIGNILTAVENTL